MAKWARPQTDIQIQCNFYQNSTCPFCRKKSAYPKIYMELQGNLDNQNNLEKGELSWRTQNSPFRNLLQSYSVILHKNEHKSTGRI